MGSAIFTFSGSIFIYDLSSLLRSSFPYLPNLPLPLRSPSHHPSWPHTLPHPTAQISSLDRARVSPTHSPPPTSLYYSLSLPFLTPLPLQSLLQPLALSLFLSLQIPRFTPHAPPGLSGGHPLSFLASTTTSPFPSLSSLSPPKQNKKINTKRNKNFSESSVLLLFLVSTICYHSLCLATRLRFSVLPRVLSCSQ